MAIPRWRKVFSDLWSNRTRTLLAAISIAVGIFSVGVVSGIYTIMGEDVPRSYLSVNPQSSLIFAMPFDEEFLVSVRRVEGVADAEGRTSVTGRVMGPAGKQIGIEVAGTPPLSEVRINKLKLLNGPETLGAKEIYLESSSLAALGKKIGDTIEMELPDGRRRTLRIAGEVYNATIPAFALMQTVSAYSDFDTIEWLGGIREYTGLLLTMDERGDDEAHVREVSERVSRLIQKSGREVFVTIVQNPGHHPAQQIMNTLLALLGGMGVLSLFLSTFLVVNTISALLSQQVRQIGIMKAIGATAGQLLVMYLILIMLYGIVALLFAVPVSGLAAYGVCSIFAGLLNVQLLGFRIPTSTLLLEVLVGMFVPLVAGIIPVMGGVRMTVRQAIANYGLSGGGRSLFDAILENVRGLPRPLLISLRNTFRKKARLALTLSTLILAGAIFIAVFSVREAMRVEIEKTFGYILSDVNINFNRAYRMERVQDAVRSIPGVTAVEGWGSMTAQAMDADGKTGDEIAIMAPPAGSTMITPTMTKGRWLLPEDQNAIVVGNHFMAVRPETKVGDVVTLRILSKDYPFTVVGIYRMAGTVIPPIVYTNAEYLARILNEPNQVYSLRISTIRSDQEFQTQVGTAMMNQFEKLGISVGSMTTGAEMIASNRVTTDILVYMLLVMAALIAIVGGLGLTGTMSMNVLERTREIGVMRSIGAVDAAVMRMVIIEGMVIGVISWALGTLLSIPIANGLNALVGVAFLMVPMQGQFSVDGMIIWVVVVLVLSAVASILPAKNAVRLTVRDVLAYE